MAENLKGTLEAINKSALNTSKSKAMFSFNKATRFESLRDSNSSFYSKPSTISKRATSFGYGTKSELVSRYHNSPSPDKYQKKSEFENSPKKGLSMGLGRDDCKNVSIFNTSKYPAPTDYSHQEKEKVNVFSIRGKVKLPELFPDRKTPGPGQYQNENISKNGSAFNSKYKTNVCYKIHEKSPSKQEKENCPSLGPQSYDTAQSANGKQILSKKRTEKTFYFDKRPRVTMHVNASNPGPGSYSFFSEFNR